jgi:hypothetical protein
MADRLLRWLPVALVCGFLAWIAQWTSGRLTDPDDWWHLRLGNDLIAQHSLTAPHHWSSFATVSWAPTEAVPEVVSAFVDRTFGLPGLAWLYALFAMLVAVTVYLTNRREGSAVPAAVATAFAVLAGSSSLTARPQLLSFILLPVVLAAWFQTERDLKPRWWLLPLAWFWSMCHGFWFIGVAYGFLFVVGIALSRRADVGRLLRLALVAAGSFAVVALNPSGPRVLEAPFAVQGMAKYITEWQRTDLTQPGPVGCEIMIVATAVIWLVTRRGASWARVLMLVTAAFWLWYAVRMVIVAGIVVSPLFAGALEVLLTRQGTRQGTSTTRPREGIRREALIVGTWVALTLVVLGFVVPHTASRPGSVPLALDRNLDRLPPGTPVFNAYELGGWITWRHPDLDQYIDGLATPYSTQHAEDFHRAEIQASGWYRVVTDSGAPVALVESDSALARGLEHRGWSREGTSSGYVLLCRPGYRVGVGYTRAPSSSGSRGAIVATR